MKDFLSLLNKNIFFAPYAYLGFLILGFTVEESLIYGVFLYILCVFVAKTYKYLRFIWLSLIYKPFTKVIFYVPIVYLLALIFGFTTLKDFLLSLLLLVPIIIAYLPFMRAYSTNRVFNYVLANNVHLPRLYEREPQLVGEYYFLKDIHDVQKNNDFLIQGKILKREVSTLEYWFALFFWHIIDNDSNHDTFNGGKIAGLVYGNAFDLGDTRAEYPQWRWKESILWFIRNSVYDFTYLFEEIAEDNPNNFFIVIKIFGFTTIWGYIPYENSTRQGRAVYFQEDLKYIDKEVLEKYSI